MQNKYFKVLRTKVKGKSVFKLLQVLKDNPLTKLMFLDSFVDKEALKLVKMSP